jgi:TDG/mug DNA glycosylase family protein
MRPERPAAQPQPPGREAGRERPAAQRQPPGREAGRERPAAEPPGREAGRDPTLAVYEARAGEWRDRRVPPPASLAAARALAERAGTAGPVLDAGCGPGFHAAVLGERVVALDAARAMLDLVGATAPDAWPLRADLAHLPVRRGALAGAWAARSYVHLARSAVPAALADLHRSLAVGAPVEVVLFGGDLEHGPEPGDDFPGRRFSLWTRPLLDDVVTGAGFAVDEIVERDHGHGEVALVVRARRARTLADTVGPGLRVLVCGLNPSLYAADAGVGFARPGNRFWPAALTAGLVTRDRDPARALAVDGVGMTDLVKRATARADELAPGEYRRGLARVERLVAWLRPRLVLVVGLSGWRVAMDRSAVAGVQERRLGGRPVYLMPNTSGLNARATPAVLAGHIDAALRYAAVAED